LLTLCQLPSSDRRHEASTQFSNVKKRHHSIHDIERQLIELAQLFQELDVIVQQHAPLIVNIEHRSEDVSDEVTKGNGEIDAAIKSARTHNQKKWWCFLIVALTVMVVIAVVVTLVMKKTVHA
jgi:syntaxin 1B/2/3